jgi:hypothetical protein
MLPLFTISLLAFIVRRLYYICIKIIKNMINIALKKELDYEVYNNFHNFSIAGKDFGELIKKDHPEISLENYKKYIDNFYLKNNKLLNNLSEEINKELFVKQNIFFKAIQGIFYKDFSKNTYNGFLSIFNCNPRFVDEKEFQVFYKKNNLERIGVIFHEVLHFIFFEYCDNNLKEETKDLDKNSGSLWELSEIFNVIILNRSKFREILKKEEKLFYPNLKNKFEHIKNNFADEKVGDFIKNSFIYLRDIK